MYLSYLMWLLVAAAAFAIPQVGEGAWGRVERSWVRIARHTTLSWVGVGIFVLALRAVLLPILPIPKPVIYDEFSYLLGADTFASGRVANPSPAVPAAFESPYVLQRPSYASKYPPGQALVMALGQKMLWHPWFGVWLSAGAMCAAVCWALQGWAPAEWALLGGLLTAPLGVFTYWMDSYWGGALAGLGGALVLGSYGRIVRRGERGWGWGVGVGLVILANTRMLEGAIVGVVVGIGLLARYKNCRRDLATALAVVVCGAGLMGWYNWRVTGHATRMPYIEYERQYAIAPFFTFLPMGETHFFANPVMEDLHQNWDVRAWREARSPGVLLKRPKELLTMGTEIFGNSIWVVILLASVPVLAVKRELRVPLICVGLALAASFSEISYFPHYAGPIVAALFLLLICGLRELRNWGARGRFLSRAIPCGAFLLLCRAELPALYRHEPFEATHPRNARRERVQASLRARAGRHLVIVRYTGQQSPHEEWVYNGADLNASAVVWAHDLGDIENRRLIAAFPGRSVWLFEPDIDTERFIPLQDDKILSPGANSK